MNTRVVLRRFLLVFTMALVAVSASAQDRQKVIVTSTGSPADLKNTVLSLGGQIHHEYTTFTALAASLSFDAVLKLRGMAGFRVIKDVVVDAPKPQDPDGGTSGIATMPAAQSLSLAQLKQMGKGNALPSDYLFNDSLIHADALINSGFDGTGVIVADIDTGTANNPAVVPALAGTVIGGETFVVGDPVTSPTSTMNAPHGTWTGTMIAAHVAFLFSNSNCFSQAMQFDAPGSILDGTPFGFPGFQVVPMLGVAPGASIYAMKVFSSQGGGASSSTIIAAIDRVLFGGIKVSFPVLVGNHQHAALMEALRGSSGRRGVGGRAGEQGPRRRRESE